ncbi:MAG: 16S rRNA (cytidine(1402)-2'-O)-methyltransferase [Clostridiales bacterium]|jgi:16S rRNA (cytidine1402-2'-O)-methyltransferase|nr:16S rRNA (cytidine(1402)-2'-O)-methyltransferase [Clostridiales bacterium]
MKNGILYVVATPIGNLGDISKRGIDTLSEVDLVAAEDTRRSGLLLSRLGIKKPLVGYYKEKENSRAELIIQKLKEGLNAALISDAGTPCVSDPGAVLVRRAREEGIAVFPVPGACAATAAFSVSGLSGGYVFIGFLPRKTRDRSALVSEIKALSLPLIFYSAPHDVNDDLEFLYRSLGARKVYVMREMTKIYEDMTEGVLGEITVSNEKGEFVVIVGGAEVRTGVFEISAGEELQALIDGGAPPKEAIKTVAKNRKVEKDVIYKEYLRIKD